MHSYLLHQVIRILARVSDRYSPSRMLTFDAVHVFKTFQLMKKHGSVSRTLLMQELGLGEGSIKTLVKHLKMNALVETSNGGMWMSEKGLRLYSKLSNVIASEMTIPKCSINIGKFNHAVLLKGEAAEVGNGIEQRDAAIKSGAVGATTLVFDSDRFLMPGKNMDPVKSEPNIIKSMTEKLHPENGDVVIIGSADNKRIAEFAAKSAALITVSAHHKH